MCLKRSTSIAPHRAPRRGIFPTDFLGKLDFATRKRILRLKCPGGECEMVNRALVVLICIVLILIPFGGGLIGACAGMSDAQRGEACGCGCAGGEHQESGRANCSCVIPCAPDRVSLRSDIPIAPTPDSAYRMAQTTDSSEPDVSYRRQPGRFPESPPYNHITLILKTCVFRS